MDIIISINNIGRKSYKSKFILALSVFKLVYIVVFWWASCHCVGAVLCVSA